MSRSCQVLGQPGTHSPRWSVRDAGRHWGKWTCMKNKFSGQCWIARMGFGGYLRLPIAMAVLVWIALPSAAAETRLSDFNGKWHGNGTDRDTPLESTQPTNCRMRIQADLRHLNSETTCNGQAGLHKVLRLTITLEGDQFTGEASQTSAVTNGTAKVLNGTVIGHKSNEMASLQVRFPGLTPSAVVVLRRLNPSTFTMNITSLGLALTNVTFDRTTNH